jgi:hypothetical protein
MQFFVFVLYITKRAYMAPIGLYAKNKFGVGCYYAV